MSKAAQLAGEHAFVSALDNAGVTYGSISGILEIGRAICHDLSVSVAPRAVLSRLRNSGFDAHESRVILVAAIDTIYDGRNPTVISWMRANGY